MSKRQKRIYTADIPGQIEQLLKQEVSIIMKDKSVLHVRLLSFKNNIFEAKDLILRKHLINVDSVDEIILELNA
ncbi:MAG: hypothetical protein RIC80_09410 [Cyclobacteriaceae bacterium]